jgi:type IV secretion system protein VirB2
MPPARRCRGKRRCNPSSSRSKGPVAKIIAVIIIITTGLTLAFGDTSGGFRRLIQIVFGLSIAFAASSFFLSFFSFGGGALV